MVNANASRQAPSRRSSKPRARNRNTTPIRVPRKCEDSDRPDREVRRQDDQAAAERRRRPGDEQHDSCRESQNSDEDRRQASGDAGEALVRVPPTRRRRDSNLKEGKQAGGKDERQHVVDAAIRQQRGGDGV